MRPRSRSTAFLAAAAISGITTLAVLSLLTSEEGNGGIPRDETTKTAAPERSPSPLLTEAPPEFATVTSVNREGSYSFGHPPLWRVTIRETVSTATAPDDKAVVTFGFGRPGALDQAMAELAELLRSSYRVVAISPQRSTTVNDNDALRIAGRVRNDEGALLRFQLFVLRAAGENYAISVFVRDDASSRVDKVVDEIVESFSPAATG